MSGWVVTMTPRDFSYVDLLEHNARLQRDAPALIGAFATVSHGALLERCQDVARVLQHLGVQVGDRIALLAFNGPRTLELLGAAALCGAVLVLLNTRASATETVNVVADSGAQHMFVEIELAHLTAELPLAFACHSLGAASGRLLSWPQVPGAQALVPAAVTAAMPLVGIPTAAVEGRPRIAMLSHGALLHQAMQLGICWSLTQHDRHLCILPLFHMAGLGLLLAVQMGGGASVLMARFDAAAAVDAIEAHGVSCFTSFAPILTSVLDAADERQAALASLRAVTGLEPLQVTERLAARCSQALFWSGYGQTETGGLVTLSPATERPGSAGRPLVQVALRIARASGTCAGIGESGDILVRSPSIFNGYWQTSVLGAHPGGDGWHRTGDLGRIDADGYLWYEGRAPEKALIKSGGENIYPAEVEQALLAHPAVAQARVVGVPDEKWGEAVRALCVLHASAQVPERELIEFVGTRIARFKRPREVVFVASLDEHTEHTA